MKLISCQVALFAMEKIKRPDLLLNEINAKLSNLFDAESDRRYSWRNPNCTIKIE